MELNEKVIGDLSSRLKIDSEVLKTALTDETKELALDVTVLTSEEKATLESNIKKQGYSEGKKAGEEMQFKNFKNSKGLEIEANNFDDYFSKFEESVKSNFTGDLDAKLVERDSKISKLQKSLLEKDSLIESTKSEYDNKLKGIRANTLIESEVSKLEFDVPATIEALGETEVSKYIEAKRKQALTLFKSTYKTDFVEDKAVFLNSDGKKLTNELQDDLAISDVMKQFAKNNYLTIAENNRKGRGGQNSSHTSGTLKGVSKDQMVSNLRSKKILGTAEGDAVYAKWLQDNK